MSDQFASPLVEQDQKLAKLRAAIARYQVYWEVWPEYQFSGDHRRFDTGFRLELHGRHLPGRRPAPGCDLCREIFAALREITFYILPKEKRDSFYEVTPFDAALEYDSPAEKVGHVTLAIVITPRGSSARSMGPCQLRCLREMEQQLHDLGAIRGGSARVGSRGVGPGRAA
jgi:hypothetical protein